MSNFTRFEYYALSAIFELQPKQLYGLMRQLWAAEIAERECSGSSFYIAIDVPDDLALDELPMMLENSVRGYVDGMLHPLGFNLFTKSGRLCLLEVFSLGDEDTARLSSECLNFRITKAHQVPSGGKPLCAVLAAATSEDGDIGTDNMALAVSPVKFGLPLETGRKPATTEAGLLDLLPTEHWGRGSRSNGRGSHTTF